MKRKQQITGSTRRLYNMRMSFFSTKITNKIPLINIENGPNHMWTIWKIEERIERLSVINTEMEK